MLTRVRRLEQARAPAVSPITAAYGSFEAFAAWCEAGMAAGRLDRTDLPVVLQCLRRWDQDWGGWHRDARPGRFA